MKIHAVIAGRTPEVRHQHIWYLYKRVYKLRNVFGCVKLDQAEKSWLKQIATVKCFDENVQEVSKDWYHLKITKMHGSLSKKILGKPVYE